MSPNIAAFHTFGELSYRTTGKQRATRQNGPLYQKDIVHSL
jgi:hypothetical protein